MVALGIKVVLEDLPVYIYIHRISYMCKMSQVDKFLPSGLLPCLWWWCGISIILFFYLVYVSPQQQSLFYLLRECFFVFFFVSSLVLHEFMVYTMMVQSGLVKIVIRTFFFFNTLVNRYFTFMVPLLYPASKTVCCISFLTKWHSQKIAGRKYIHYAGRIFVYFTLFFVHNFFRHNTRRVKKEKTNVIKNRK